MNKVKMASIEVTNFCNYKCSKCFHAHDTFNKDKKFIDEITFKKILNKLPNFVEYIGLSGIGESLIHPNFWELVDICKEVKPKCLVGFHTNGSLLNDENINIILSKKNIDDINISIDAITNQTHFCVHHNKKNINDIFVNIAKLIKKRDEIGSKLRITTSFVIQKENISELIPFILAMKGLGVDYIGPINLINPLPGYKIENWKENFEQIEKEINQARELAEILKIKIDLPKLKDRRFGSANMEHTGREACAFPFELYPIIDCFGNVYPCVWLQFQEKYIIGNIINDDIEEIYNGKKISKIRNTLKENCYFKECLKCNPGGIYDDNIIIKKI